MPSPIILLSYICILMKAIVNGGTPIALERQGNTFRVDGSELIYDLQLLKPGTYHIILNSRSYTIEVILSDLTEKKHQLRINGKVFDVSLVDRYDDLLHELGLDVASSKLVGDLKAPMPGLVVNIPVQEGQEVKAGDTLVILEAMKMENALKAVADATIKAINVKKGQAVEKNELLIRLA
jgi:biotin carboxyl carrier protein